MTGYESKKKAAQAKLEQDAFNAWWYSTPGSSNNPYETDSFAYWAWEGWQAAKPAQGKLDNEDDLTIAYQSGYYDGKKAAREPIEAWPCVIETADFEKNTVTLTMQCTNYKVSAGKHWLSTNTLQRNQSKGNNMKLNQGKVEQGLVDELLETIHKYDETIYMATIFRHRLLLWLWWGGVVNRQATKQHCHRLLRCFLSIVVPTLICNG